MLFAISAAFVVAFLFVVMGSFVIASSGVRSNLKSGNEVTNQTTQFPPIVATGAGVNAAGPPAITTVTFTFTENVVIDGIIPLFAGTPATPGAKVNELGVIQENATTLTYTQVYGTDVDIGATQLPAGAYFVPSGCPQIRSLNGGACTAILVTVA